MISYRKYFYDGLRRHSLIRKRTPSGNYVLTDQGWIHCKRGGLIHQDNVSLSMGWADREIFKKHSKYYSEALSEEQVVLEAFENNLPSWSEKAT